MNIEYSGYSHSFEKNPLDIESDLYFKERCWFIAHFYPQFSGNYKQLVLYSRLWTNIKFNHCEYSIGIMKTIRELVKDTGFDI